METITQHHWRLILSYACDRGELYGFRLLLQGGAVPTNDDGSIKIGRDDLISLKNRLERFRDPGASEQTCSHDLAEVVGAYVRSLEKTLSKFGLAAGENAQKWRVTLNWGVSAEDGDYCTTVDATSADNARFLCAAEMADSMDIDDYHEMAEFISLRLAESHRCEVVLLADRLGADLREFLEGRIPAGAAIDMNVIAHAITEHHRLVTTGSMNTG